MGRGRALMLPACVRRPWGGRGEGVAPPPGPPLPHLPLAAFPQSRLASDHNVLERTTGLLTVGRLRLQGSEQPGEPDVHADLLTADPDAARGVPDGAAHGAPRD